MGKARHTPGPWDYAADDKLNAHRAFGINRKWNDGEETGTETIAEVCESDVPGQAEADARLIAAAPDLLDALQELCKKHGIDSVKKGRAAIAKATGPRRTKNAGGDGPFFGNAF